MRATVLMLIVTLLLAPLAPAFAQGVTPSPVPGESRIRTILYNPDQVIALRGHLGYQMMIEFDPNERIENVSIGDSLGWQVTPNRKATLLFLKPLERNAVTNMTVVTNQRTYVFALSSTSASGPSDPALIYKVRFTYPAPPPVPAPEPPPPPPQPTPEQLNFNYSFSGSERLAPTRVFDDGQSTFFQFAPNTDAPAIFVIGADGKEELANTQTRGEYTVIDRLAQTFTLRYGAVRTQVHNDAWQEAARPDDAPQKRRRFRVFGGD